MKATRHISTFIKGFIPAASLLILSACGSTEQDKPVVVVQNDSTTEDFQRAVELQCPDIEIKWFLSSNSHENFYKLQDPVPDIISKKTFYINKQPQPYIRDISDKILMSGYSRNIIDNFREQDGTIKWIPAIGSSYVLMGHKDLFDQYGIPVPTDFKSLADADKAFKKHGIDGIAWGLGKNWHYACLLVAQALNADLFNSFEGVNWKKKYQENTIKPGATYTLDDKLWPEVFRRMKEAVDCGVIDKDDIVDGTVEASEKFKFGEAAMFLCPTGNKSAENNPDAFIIPLFDFTGTQWCPIYLNMSFAVSSSVSEVKLPAVMKVLDALRSTESAKAFNDSRGGIVPLNDDPSVLLPKHKALSKPISDGYSFLLFNEQGQGLVNGFYESMCKMCNEGISAPEALEYCKEQIIKDRQREAIIDEILNDNDPSQIIYTSEAEYPQISDENFNHPAASSLLNTTLASMNSLSPDRKYDVMVALPSISGMPVEKKSYYLDKEGKITYSSNFHYLFNSRRSFYAARISVARLIQYINNSFYHFHRIDDGLPVMAGASYRVEKHEDGIPDSELPFKPGSANGGHIANSANFPTRYICKAIIRDGQELPDDEMLDVAIARECVFYMTDQSKEWKSTFAGFEPAISLDGGLTKGCVNIEDYVFSWIRKGGVLLEPTRYLYLEEAAGN